jgi:hypothetical protein
MKMTKKEKQKLVDIFEAYMGKAEYTDDEISLKEYYGINREYAEVLILFYAGYLAGRVDTGAAIERLEHAMKEIQFLLLADEDDEKFRDMAIHDISEVITQLTSVDLGAPYKEAAHGKND